MFRAIDLHFRAWYLPNRMRSPGATSRTVRWPDFRRRPLPTAMTSACWGFFGGVRDDDAADDGFTSLGPFTSTRSCKGALSWYFSFSLWSFWVLDAREFEFGHKEDSRGPLHLSFAL